MNRCLNGILRLCAEEHTRISIPQPFGMVEHAGKADGKRNGADQSEFICSSNIDKQILQTVHNNDIIDKNCIFNL